MTGKLRFFMHWPKKAMVADGLTKVGLLPQLMKFITTGKLELPMSADQYVRMRLRVARSDFIERDLEELDW